MATPLLEKPPLSDPRLASLPWQGVLSLAGHWAGSGSLLNWIRPAEWEIERNWSADLVKARLNQSILTHIQEQFCRSLPRHQDEWLDAIGQHSLRAAFVSDVPTAHTDWVATISAYGSYPSQAYVDRRHVLSEDNPFTRVLEWSSRAVLDADEFVERRLGRRPLNPKTARIFISALALPHFKRDRALELPSEFDLDACKQAGGVWLSLYRIASLLNAVRAGGATAQLHALRPILPSLAHQLFELGVLGTVAMRIHRAAVAPALSTDTPLAAAATGRPCLSLETNSLRWQAFYQTLPNSVRTSKSPYQNLTSDLQGGQLRPDIWIEQTSADGKVELLLECKYSLDLSYVASGVQQIFAYLVEFPPLPGVRRLHIVVAPDEVVQQTVVSHDQLAIANPAGAAELCERAFRS